MNHLGLEPKPSPARLMRSAIKLMILYGLPSNQKGNGYFFLLYAFMHILFRNVLKHYRSFQRQYRILSVNH